MNAKHLSDQLKSGTQTVYCGESLDDILKFLENHGLVEGEDFNLVAGEKVNSVVFASPNAACMKLAGVDAATTRPEVVEAVNDMRLWTRNNAPMYPSERFLPSLYVVEHVARLANPALRELQPTPLFRESKNEGTSRPPHGMFFRPLNVTENVATPDRLLDGMPELDEFANIAKSYPHKDDKANYALDYLTRDTATAEKLLNGKGVQACMLVACAPFAENLQDEAPCAMKSRDKFVDYLARVLRTAIPSRKVDLLMYAGTTRPASALSYAPYRGMATDELAQLTGLNFHQQAAFRMVLLVVPTGTKRPSKTWLSLDEQKILPSQETPKPKPKPKRPPKVSTSVKELQSWLMAQGLWWRLVTGGSTLERVKKPGGMTPKRLSSWLLDTDWDCAFNPNANPALQMYEAPNRTAMAATLHAVSAVLYGNSNTRDSVHIRRVVPALLPIDCAPDAMLKLRDRYADTPTRSWTQAEDPTQLAVFIETDVEFDAAFKATDTPMFTHFRRIARAFLVEKNGRYTFPQNDPNVTWRERPRPWTDLVKYMPDSKYFALMGDGLADCINATRLKEKDGTATVCISLCGEAARTVLFTEALVAGLPDPYVAVDAFAAKDSNLTPPEPTLEDALMKMDMEDVVHAVEPFRYRTCPTHGGMPCVLMEDLASSTFTIG